MPHAARTPPPPTAAALPREAVSTPPAADDAQAWGCGWYASSFELRCGVEVYEEYPALLARVPPGLVDGGDDHAGAWASGRTASPCRP